VPTVALIGNPNTGKSTLFSALVGIRQHVGNYPGVTVEKKTGCLEHEGRSYELVDLPGLYSLGARSQDERVAVDVLLGRQSDVGPPDAVLSIVDASNLERNLYLVSQVLELGLPTLVAVNMLDVASARGVTLDLVRLQERLGTPVVGIQANRGTGLAELKAALAQTVGRPAAAKAVCFPQPFEREVDLLEKSLAPESTLPRPLLRRILLDTSGHLLEVLLPAADGRIKRQLAEGRARLAEAAQPVPAVETAVRYDWARSILEGVVREPRRYRHTASDRIDRLLTHRLWGTLVFALVMTLVFQSVFLWARPLMRWIEAACSAAGGWIEAALPEGALRSLLTQGILGGAGSVLAFLPQIMILFLFIAVLEDCGYMARAAYLMDRLMCRVGLSGRSFIPMLSSFACAVPGIMAARVIENERDRLTTILVAPLLTCSARLPIYALLIAAFIPAQTCLGGLLSLQGLTLAALYVLGIVAAVLAALVLKRTILRGRTPPFLMELPSYKWPSPQTAVYRVLGRAWLFLRTAGTLILAVSVLVWAAAYWPRARNAVEPLAGQARQIEARIAALPPASPDREPLRRQLADTRNQIAAVYQQHSLLGRLGRLIEPAVRPLGWDWRIGCAVLASLPAREIVVATLGVVYGVGTEVHAGPAESLAPLQTRLRQAAWDGTDRPVFTLPTALSVMVFYALCAQCAATLAVIRRETNSWRWPAFAFTYMTVLAYLGALATYQVGTWVG
jgi:ferrous iron transport protein B